MPAAPRVPFKNPVVEWVDVRLPLFSLWRDRYAMMPVPRNLNGWWVSGALALFTLAVMIVSGVFLAMHYTPTTAQAFASVERTMREVNWGWLLRAVHMNGASLFFAIVYAHILRSVYYGSYKRPRELLWLLGVVLFLLMMATAFMGSVLPWSQTGYWSATVVANLFRAIPFVGEPLVTWLIGGPEVGEATLRRFFALHYLLPFAMIGVAFLHVAAQHVAGANNPLGIDPKSPQDTVPFHPRYTSRDLFGLAVFVLVFAAIVFFAPAAFVAPASDIPADPMTTPDVIVPAWYFLPFFAMLRSVGDLVVPFTAIVLIPAQLGGVLALFGALLTLLLLPWLDRSPVRSAVFRPLYKKLFWLLVLDLALLGYVGAQEPEGLCRLLGRLATAYYFLHFLIFLPLLPRIEKPQPLPSSIAEAVRE